MKKILVTLFGGWFGLHKFIDGKIVMGVIYLFTCGLFFVGWAFDVIVAITEYIKGNNNAQTPQNNIEQYYPINFTVAGATYYKDSICSILKKSNHSDFIYLMREDYCQLVPEPTNPHDKNAIKVVMDGVTLGYVPADKCEYVSKYVNSRKFKATIRGGATTTNPDAPFKIYVEDVI